MSFYAVLKSVKKVNSNLMSQIHNRPDNRTVAHSFDKIAFTYNFWSSITESDALRKAFEFCDIQDGMTVLEAGVGTGRFLEWVVQANPSGFNLGVDLSIGMLSEANKRVQEFHSGSYQLIQGDVSALPVRKESCDRIVSTFVFDLLPENEHLPILHYMYNILNSDGKIVLATMTETKHLTHRAWGWFANTFPSLFTYCRPINIKPALQKANFSVERNEVISQNTFPSEVILAKKKTTN